MMPSKRWNLSLFGKYYNLSLIHISLWLRYFIRWCGPLMIRQFPFEECYFLERCV